MKSVDTSTVAKEPAKFVTTSRTTGILSVRVCTVPPRPGDVRTDGFVDLDPDAERVLRENLWELYK